MRVDWVNHASFVLDTPGVRLLCDPWLEGTAFDNGWALLAPTRFSCDDFASITHIWFSHEHPDHFNPSVLRKIPAATRGGITVLYQKTRDKKVVAYCQSLGFRRVVELGCGEWRALGRDLRVLCEPYRDGDSWLLIESNARRLLNINDCVFEMEQELRGLRRRLTGGKLDVLFTQFSFANWAGNRDDAAYRAREAARKLEAIRRQAAMLRPTHIVPFASFIWFCHEENYYQNAGMNRIDDVRRMIAADTGAVPIVLYPGETWTVGEPHDSAASAIRYAAHYAQVFDGTPRVIAAQPTEWSALVQGARGFIRALEEENGRLVLRLLRLAGVLQPVRIYLSDHERSAVFSLDEGLVERALPYHECDIALGSQALSYCFQNLWGGTTLAVNGRYQCPPNGNYARFRRYATLASLNNQGKGLGGYLPTLIGRMRRRPGQPSRWNGSARDAA